MHTEKIIRTPDQRLRVFISSTLKELADERTSVRSSVERLRLIPVMFELGARPHPPKDLYQAYLKQSNIFIGIYWQSYGWIAENETISGIEDEYRLSGTLPSLIYVKEPAPQREDKLTELLNDIRSKGDVSYKSFSTADELEKLVTDDLAILLSERFFTVENSEPEVTESKGVHTNIPDQLPQIIGREYDIQRIKELIVEKYCHLVTITGTGGIGKTKVALAAAKSLTSHFDDGVYFVDLSNIEIETDIFKQIASALGIQLSSSEDPAIQITGFISSQKVLLILDNFEQLSSSASKISSFIHSCPNLSIIITSRNTLNMAIENEYRLPALSAPAESDEFHKTAEFPSVKVFVNKAKLADSNFVLTEENFQEVGKICRLLDGIPLAIGLAAAKVRVFSPKMIVERLSKKLNILSGGFSDAPERHKTMRAAIEWSVELLTEQEKTLFMRLAVFIGGFDFEALEKICSNGLDDAAVIMESLLIKNLIKKEMEVNGLPRYNMPGLLLEYAEELFNNSDEQENILMKHALYYYESAVNETAVFSGQQPGAVSRKWGYDAENVIKAAETLCRNEKYAEAVNLIYSLWQLFWIFDHDNALEKKVNLLKIIDKAKDLSEEDYGKLVWLAGANALGKGDEVNAEKFLTQALLIFSRTNNKSGFGWANHLITSIHAAKHQDKSNEKILKSFEESARLFRESGDFWGECGVIQNSAALETMLKHYSKALKLYDEYERLAKKIDNMSQQSHIQIMRGWIHINMKKYDKALEYLKRGMDYYSDGTTPEGLCYALIISALYFFRTKNEQKAMFMAGVLDNIMPKFGFTPWQMISSVSDFVKEKVRNTKDQNLKDEYEKALNMGIYKAIRLANEKLQSEK